jgi:predicted ArsR family transcriptional regulator
MTELDLEETTLTQRVVLLGVTDCVRADSTPTHAGEVIRTCSDRLDAVEGDVLGSLSEADVARALKELATQGLIERAALEDTSPVGKGRPTYELTAGTGQVLELLAADERLTVLVDRLREA